jgi:hypothetical protein
MSSQVLATHSKVCIWSIPVAVLLIDPSRSDPINLPKLLALVACAFISITLLIFSSLSPGQISKLRPKRIGWLYIGFASYLMLVGLTGSPNWIRALFGAVGRNNGLLYYVAAICLVLVIFVETSRSLHLRYLIKWLGITSIIFGIYCVIQFVNLDPIAWASGLNRIIGTLGNPNFSASLLGIFSVYWMFMVYNLELRIEVIARISMFCLSLIFAFLSWSTESLQGPLVVIMGFLLILISKLNQNAAWHKYIFGIFGSILAGFLFLFVSFLGFGPLGDSLQQYTLKLRGLYISIGLQSIRSSPIYGVGVDNYGTAFRQYRDLNFVKTYGVNLYTDNAHSTPVQIGASFGLVAFLFYCFIQILILFRALIILTNNKFEGYAELKLVAILWILVFAQSLLSIENIGIGVLNWVLGAFILRDSLNFPERVIREPRKFSTNLVPEWYTAATFILICFSTLPYFFVAREDSKYRQLSRVQVQSDIDRKFVGSLFNDLSSLTLFEPSKVSLIVPKLYEARMSSELNKTVKDLVERNDKDPVALEIQAIYQSNAGKKQDEVQTRLLLRELDPYNYILELRLAETLFELEDWVRLGESLSRIKQIAPLDSDEYLRSNQLQMMMVNFQK